MYVVADFDTEAGLGLVKEALSSIDDTSKTRVSFVHNPGPGSIGPDPTVRPPVSWLLSHLLAKNLLSKASPARLLRALGLDPSVTIPLGDGSQIPLKDDVTDLTDGVGLSGYGAEDYARFVRSSRLLARELQLKPGELGLVVNGRVVGPIEAGDFGVVDFKTLESYELRRRTEPVIKALESVKPAFMESDRASSSHLISMASSVLATLYAPEANGGGIFDAPKRPRQRSYEILEDQYSSFQFGNNSTALYHIAVILDPLSEVGQRWSSLLEWLSHIPNMYIKVYINPAAHEEVGLASLHLFPPPSLSIRRSPSNASTGTPCCLPSPSTPKGKLSFTCVAPPRSDSGLQRRGSRPGDLRRPPHRAHLHPRHGRPPSWLVRPREALYDLDNIQLGSLSPQDTSVDAVFGLDYIVVDGHARDSLTNAPPRGVQLQLLNGGGDATPVDDTQVVANLGYLQFKAKPGVFQLEIRQGRGRDIFAMESVGGEGLDSRTVAEVGNEIAVTSFEGLTIYPRLSRLPGMEREDVLAGPEEDEAEPAGMFEDIASRVKSLFFKETPAPTALVPVSGQADINIFTVASGLLYERFVSIMILSVLRNTNSTVKFWFIENFLSPSFLEFIPHLAAAYNFQNRGLSGRTRFSSSTYWKDFLQGRPYHISALYVIDLVRFRKLAAGDILRGSYQQLSADPGSLANLDQDLPNNLQREVPIFSLPEDWLWCETWCSKERLHRAKTIDLCQNPLTKEPKLVRARQIPEWEEYDSEISRFARKLAEEGVIRSRMVAADANALAASGAGGSQPDIKSPSPSAADVDLPPLGDEAPRDEL
ncbi:hypothetical protein K438DRAFT_547782 [Mycena galopus ATCC 62051]|nr:hypothetical protein K438DRAFT_547782 [Mycena galopus ATCC 62051]